MSKLIYMANCSVDGFIEDAAGRFDWAIPSEDLHQFANDTIRMAPTFFYGRRMYETMQVWETMPSLAAEGPVMAEFAQLWQAGEKMVFSHSLEAPVTKKTRIERSFDPKAIAQLKERSAKPLMVGGANLAAQFFAAGLVDEVVLVYVPIAVGSGKSALPQDRQVRLELLSERRFDNGGVGLTYSVKR